MRSPANLQIYDTLADPRGRPPPHLGPFLFPFLCSFGEKLAKLIVLYQLLGLAPPWDILDPPLHDQIVPFQCFKTNDEIPCQLLWDSYPKLASDKFLYLIGSS